MYMATVLLLKSTKFNNHTTNYHFVWPGKSSNEMKPLRITTKATSYLYKPLKCRVIRMNPDYSWEEHPLKYFLVPYPLTWPHRQELIHST